MDRSYVCRKTLFVLLAALLLAPLAWPQASTGSVSGTVRDQTGAVIPGSAVVITSATTNVTSRTQTNEVGFYMFPGITPGGYRLEIEHPGMQKFEATVTVQVARSVVIDPVLKPGQTTTVVEVRDVTPMITVDSPTLTHVLERTRIEQLPINGRFITALMQTMPGLEQETEYDGVSTRAFGMRRGSSEFVLDGASTTDPLLGGVFRRPPGLDTGRKRERL